MSVQTGKAPSFCHSEKRSGKSLFSTEYHNSQIYHTSYTVPPWLASPLLIFSWPSSEWLHFFSLTLSEVSLMELDSSPTQIKDQLEYPMSLGSVLFCPLFSSVLKMSSLNKQPQPGQVNDGRIDTVVLGESTKCSSFYCYLYPMQMT